MTIKKSLVPSKLQERVLTIRSVKVMTDYELAELYDVEVKVLNQAVSRNLSRFPEDFSFRLLRDEWSALRSQIVTLEGGKGQHSKYPPRVFTEQGVAMLSSVLRSERAVQVNIAIMRAFVRMREAMISHKDLALRLDAMEEKYDRQFSAVFDALRQLMQPTPGAVKKVGYIHPVEG